MKLRVDSKFAHVIWQGYFLLIRVLRWCLNEHQMQRFVRLCRLMRRQCFVDASIDIQSTQRGSFEIFQGMRNPQANTASSVLPTWIVDELRELAGIEPALYPTPELLARYHAWQPVEDTYAAYLYRQLLDDFIESRPQIIFLIPHMMRGGADLGVLHHVRLCDELGWRTTVVVTRDVPSPWLRRLPGSARVVEYGRIAREASEEDRRLVLLRLLLQSPATTLHLINSQLGWQLFEGFGKALASSGKALFASLYCDDFDRNGIRCGYATDYVPTTSTHLAGIITDNQQFKMDIQRRDGVPVESLHALYFPYVGAVSEPSLSGTRILWAGRLVAQKRPELLYAIAASAPDIQFDVFGEVALHGNAELLQRLRGLPNVRMAGAFDDFWDVAQAERYAAFLYTSAYDGLPNVLLEAAAAGLPIVAPNVGGIAELVSDTRGYLLPANAEVSHFVLALQEILGDAEGARRRAAAAQKVVLQRHSWQTFKAEVLAIPGYMPRSAITTIKARCP
ncbi:glycosyltransferase family 4 protein [Pseudomonas sp.]|uniref:glycosyltransferase family 4 protein n=1 Tax=Pseudomonas sp. TaxID=306 RepID=UPI0031D56F97